MIKESYNLPEETDLVTASLNGDKRAFGEIVASYQKMVARTVKGMLGDSVFADDIVLDSPLPLPGHQNTPPQE